jgi:protein-tyrosine phosphatase
MAGASRSASTVIAFLMRLNNWNLDIAMQLVQAKRHVVNPNFGFLSQLINFE